MWARPWETSWNSPRRPDLFKRGRHIAAWSVVNEANLTIHSIRTVALVDRMCKHLTRSATCCSFVILRAKTKAILGWCLVDKSRSWFHSSIVIPHHSTLLLKWGKSNILHSTSRPRFITIFIPLGKLQRALHVRWTTTYIHLLVTCMLPAAVFHFIQYWQRRK